MITKTVESYDHHSSWKWRSPKTVDSVDHQKLLMVMMFFFNFRRLWFIKIAILIFVSYCLVATIMFQGWKVRVIFLLATSFLVETKAELVLKKTTFDFYADFWDGQYLLMWSLNEPDDFIILVQELQGYSRPSMCFSTCSLMWPGCLEV